MSHIEEEFLQIEKQRRWHALFEKLNKDHSNEKKCDAALRGTNRILNRFRDVLPYDETRVKLKGSSDCDYINASYVQVPSAKRRYILTQGPLASTGEHFWRMVWEQNSRVIVMLTHLVEKGCSKCSLYYPDGQPTRELRFDSVDLQVTLTTEREYRYYTKRRFDLSHLKTGESRSIIHWSELDWPDHGAPNQPEPFLQLLADVRHSGAFDPRYGPPVLHCSAGIGRSGTFVLVDSILKMLSLSSNPRDVSLTDVLGSIRSQRQNLVQTVEQLRFSYLAILAGRKILDDLEHSEREFNDCDCDDEEEDEEFDCPTHPKVCGRQDNIMPNGRLTETLEDINCELMKRTDSFVSSYQTSPKSARRLSDFRFSSEDLAPSSRHVSDTSIRHRQQSSIPDPVEPTVIPSSSSASSLSWFRQGRYSLLIGVLILVSGSYLLYRIASSNTRNA